MTKIILIKAREVLDSRGNPTVEVEVHTASGFGRAIVPSGASTGEHEACELRDGGKRFGGRGVLTAVSNAEGELFQAVKGMDVNDQEALDRKMIEVDGTPNKSRLGANAILGISLAAAHAAANAKKMMLWQHLNPDAKLIPLPMMNFLNGGSHADSSVDFQEFMIMPIGANSMIEALEMGQQTFFSLRRLLKADGHFTGVGDEGGFAPNLKHNEEALEYLMKAIEGAGYKAGKDISIALDPAVSEMVDKEYEAETGALYEFKKSGEGVKSAAEMIELWTQWVDRYPIASIEDGLDENDWLNWQKLNAKLGDKIQLVGDDLLVTNTKFLKRAIEEKSCNSILVKVNQIGTLTEAIEAVKMAQAAGMTAVMSHRSGETEDASIADIAVALGTGQIKTGSINRTDRVAKYNQLLRIEEELGSKAQFSSPF